MDGLHAVRMPPSHLANATRRHRSLPDATVNALAQQVSVPAMPGVLLDLMNPQFPRGDAVFA
jgi:hypothetical protein